MSTRDDGLTPAQRAERDARLATARRMTNDELAEFTARVRAWDAENPEIAAQLTREQRGY